MEHVTVVVPTRNRRDLAQVTLNSILAQQGVQVSVVVVDDGSTDDSQRVLAALDRSRIQLVTHESSEGVAKARNDGVQRVQSEWTAFCDDDDVWAPDKLLLQVMAMRHSQRKWSYCGAVAFSADRGIRWTDPANDSNYVVNRLPWKNTIPGGCSSVVVHTDALGQDPFDLSLSTLADWDLWIRLSQGGPPAAVERYLVGYRIHDANMSLNVERLSGEFTHMDRKHRDARGGVRLNPGPWMRWTGDQQARVGRRMPAIGSYARAVRAGDLQCAAKAVVAAFGPRAVDFIHDVRRSRSEEDEARTWLEPLVPGL